MGKRILVSLGNGYSPNMGGVIYSLGGGDDFHHDGIIIYIKCKKNMGMEMYNQ